MSDYYYAPWQYELREHLPRSRLSLRLARGLRIPDPLTVTVFAGAAFLAYAPLLEPGPPAKTPTIGTLPIYQVGSAGRGMIV